MLTLKQEKSWDLKGSSVRLVNVFKLALSIQNFSLGEDMCSRKKED